MSEILSVKKRIVKICNAFRVGKDGKNTFSNYDYFKPDDILKTLNPLLEEHELISIFNLKTHETKEGYNSEDKVDYQFDIEKAEVKGANKAQNSGATLTYAKRYSLMNAFNIADNDDDFDSDKSAKTQKKENNKPNNKPSNKPSEPVDEKLKSLVSDIMVLAKTKADKDEETKTKIKNVLASYHVSGNPSKIETVEQATKCLQDINKI